MNRPEVVDVLSALASGVNPVSGEVFEEESPYNHPKVIRSLFGALEILQNPKGHRSRKSQEEINREEGRPLRFNTRWSEQEDEELIRQIEKGMLTNEIAEQLQRTRGAIHSRLQGKGLLEREELMNRADQEILELVQNRLERRKKEQSGE